MWVRIYKILILAIIFNSCVNKNEENIQIFKAKETVQKVFQLSSMDNFDSLRLIISLVSDESNDDLRIKFSGIKQLYIDEGLPLSDDLQGYNFHSSENKICTIKYLPKKDNKAAIDSIVFTFDKFNGLNRISTFEIFEAVKELKQISPSGVDSSDL